MSGKGQVAECFPVVRIVAASAVVLDHALLLAGLREPVVFSWSGRQLDLGGLAVLVFFTVSGYVISASWQADPRLVAFLRKRALRLWPALVLAVLAAAFVVGPLMTDLGTAAYLRHPETWQYLRSVTLSPVETHLPGVFVHNPESAVNMSLWTLPIEVLAYCIVAVLGQLGLFRRAWTVALLALVLAAVSFTVPPVSAAGSVLSLLGFFFLGAAIRAYPALLGRAGLVAGSVALVASLALDLYVLALPAMAVLVLWTGTRSSRVAARIQALGDPSYGIYIYSFLLQQCLVAAGMTDQLLLMPVSLLASVGLGYLSWHLLEKRAVALGRSRSARVPVPNVHLVVPQPLAVGPG